MQLQIYRLLERVEIFKTKVDTLHSLEDLCVISDFYF